MDDEDTKLVSAAGITQTTDFQKIISNDAATMTHKTTDDPVIEEARSDGEGNTTNFDDNEIVAAEGAIEGWQLSHNVDVMKQIRIVDHVIEEERSED